MGKKKLITPVSREDYRIESEGERGGRGGEIFISNLRTPKIVIDDKKHQKVNYTVGARHPQFLGQYNFTDAVPLTQFWIFFIGQDLRNWYIDTVCSQVLTRMRESLSTAL